jgi:hypothetical protein
LRFEGVDTTVLEPLVAPFIKLEFLSHACIVLGIICMLKFTNEIRELRIFPLIFFEVRVKGALQSVIA